MPNARDRVVVEYLPRLSDQIGTASEAVHRTLESAPARVDAVAQRLGDAGIIHSLQEQAQVAGTQLKSAASEASRAVTGKALVEPEKPKKRGLLIVGVIAAAVAAGVAAWKASKPVEDPWKTPAPVTPAPSTPAAETPSPVPATAVTRAGSSRCRATTSATGRAGRRRGHRRRLADKAKHVAEDSDADTDAGCHRRQDRRQEHCGQHDNGAGKTADK